MMLLSPVANLSPGLQLYRVALERRLLLLLPNGFGFISTSVSYGCVHFHGSVAFWILDLEYRLDVSW